MIILTFDTNEEINKFLLIYERYGRIVFYTIKRFVTDEYIIEDLSQEIYIVIGKNLDKIDLDNHQKTRNYIITITRNYCKNYLRQRNKVKEEPFDDIIDYEKTFEEPAEKYVHKEQINKLAQEINQLDDIYKIVLELKYINEFNDDEIAAFLKIKKKTVQMRLYRAKIILRERLEVN